MIERNLPDRACYGLMDKMLFIISRQGSAINLNSSHHEARVSNPKLLMAIAT